MIIVYQTLVWDKSSENTMTIDNSPKKLNASTSGNKNNSDIQKYLDSFNKEIAGREVTQETTSMYGFLIVVFILS